MARSAPGKHYREGISLLELTAMFPDEASAVAWFEGVRWAEGRRCPRCGFDTTAETPKPPPHAVPLLRMQNHTSVCGPAPS